ncbi:MAG: minor capsid protein [Syntrophobacterales bacterium]|jgi:SPP1 gp7 family putative phage head morphogenesis protein|nr:minor capsid protein [Syntrophobacterales bacterium]
MIDFTLLPFDEAIRFFRDKVPLTPDKYRQLTDEAKAKAFTAAGVARMDVLTDLYTGIDKAIADGTTFADFKKSVKETIEKRGWGGMNPHRLDTIYRTNIQGAYQAGHYAQQTELTGNRPYWQYVAVMDGSVRPLHAIMHRRVMRHDDPWWRENYPPNGFRCRCTVRSLSQRELDREKLNVDKNPIPAADPGFRTNPGEAMGKALTDEQFLRLQSDPKRWTPLIKKTFETYGRPKARDITDYMATSIPLWPRGKKAAEMYKSGMAGQALTDHVGDPLILNDVLIDHLNLDGRERFLPFIADVVQNPYEIWLQAEKEKDTGRIMLRKRYISVIRAGKDRPVLLVAESSRGQWTGYTMLYTDDVGYLDRIRMGILLYGR